MAGGVMLTANAAVDASKLTKASRTPHPAPRTPYLVPKKSPEFFQGSFLVSHYSSLGCPPHGVLRCRGAIRCTSPPFSRRNIHSYLRSHGADRGESASRNACLRG